MRNKLEKRVIEIAYKYKLSHLSSCLTAVNIINNIYNTKKDDEPFILSCGHAGLALYVVLEEHCGKDAEALCKKHGTHPNFDEDDGIYCSTGSLGMGLPIAVGMALADKKSNVYCLISDGESAEGSVWEALRIASRFRIENLRVACNANGYSAYDKVDVDLLDDRLNLFYPTLTVKTDMFSFPSWLQGIDGHYHVLSEEDYKEIMES